MKRILQGRTRALLALFSVALLVITLVALGACSSYGTKAPAIEITSPANGSTVPAGSVTVSVKVSNFNLVDKLGQTNVSGEGHIHYFYDVDAPTTQGQPAVTAAGTYAATTATSYSWPNVTPGTHSFSVELVNNDHTPLNPPYVAKVTVTVSSTPTPTPTVAPTGTPATTPTATPTPTGTAQSVTINLIAKNIAFNMSSITVPAGASVTVNFDNQDSGINHNFSVYENLSGGGTKPIFVGQVIMGPSQITYHFTAPAASGSYFFECDIHPTIMNGTFIVTQ